MHYVGKLRKEESNAGPLMQPTSRGTTVRGILLKSGLSNALQH